jgi:hypothetical protein
MSGRPTSTGRGDFPPARRLQIAYYFYVSQRGVRTPRVPWLFAFATAVLFGVFEQVSAGELSRRYPRLTDDLSLAALVPSDAAKVAGLVVEHLNRPSSAYVARASCR